MALKTRYQKDLFLDITPWENRLPEAERWQVGQPLNPTVPNESAPVALPLARAWLLPRENAKITLPPKESELHGTAYVLSEGILEQIDLSAQGRIRWRRFVEALAPTIHFVGKTMLVVDDSVFQPRGATARVVVDLDPKGWVQVGSERWRAEREGEGPPLEVGTAVEICGLHGHTLVVRGALAAENGLGAGHAAVSQG